MNSNESAKLTMEEIKALDKETIAPTYGRSDLVISSGKGAKCISADGKSFIDFTAGIGVNSLGFCCDEWIGAVTEQLGKIQHTSNLFYTEPQVKLAEALTKRACMSKALFVNSGAEANEAAIKIARKYGTANKGADVNRIVTLKNSFHGRTMAALTATGQDKYHKHFTPFPDGFDYCTPNDIDQLKAIVGDKTCAVMIEVIQGEGGVVDLEPDFVKAVKDICTEKGILLIIDEVQTGIGRTGKLFAAEHYHVKADMLTFAKGIGGGLPMGGVLMAESCDSVLQPGDHGSTFGGNPVVCAGALKVLEIIDEAFLKEVTEKGEYVKKRLLKMPQVTGVSGKGLMLGVSVKGKSPAAVVEAGLSSGLMLLTAGDKVRLLPPLNIGYEELNEGLNIMETLI